MFIHVTQTCGDLVRWMNACSATSLQDWREEEPASDQYPYGRWAVLIGTITMSQHWQLTPPWLHPKSLYRYKAE